MEASPKSISHQSSEEAGDDPLPIYAEVHLKRRFLVFADGGESSTIGLLRFTPRGVFSAFFSLVDVGRHFSRV